MKVCIIDDSIGLAYTVINSLQAFYRERAKHELECELLLLQVKESAQKKESIKYFKPRYKKINTKLIVYKTVDDVEKRLNVLKDVDCIYLLDLCLKDDELKCIGSDSSYKCLSMQIYDRLENQRCYFYSRFIEDAYKTAWEQRFSELYNIDVPEIIEREKLVSNYFDSNIGKKILEI